MDKLDKYSIIRMPEDEESFLAALVVLEGFIKKYGSKIQFENVKPELEFLLKLFDEQVFFKPETDKELMRLIDFDFDVARAYELSLATEKHIVDAFGIMIGVELPMHLPQVDHLQYTLQINPQPVREWLLLLEGLEQLLGMPSADDAFVELLDKNLGPGLALIGYLPPKLAYTEALRSKLVIGPCSMATYFAAAMGKTVIEIYPKRWHRGWLNKFERHTYHLITEGSRMDILIRAVKDIYAIK